MGVEVIPVGKDLYECGQIAQKMAKEINGAYISPYSNVDVILLDHIIVGKNSYFSFAEHKYFE